MQFDLEEPDGLFNNYNPILKPFQACIEWEKIENEKFMPRPMRGMNPEIDGILEKMDKIKHKIRESLKEMQAKFCCEKITFASNRKFRYQYEVPHEFSAAIEKDDNYFITARLKNAKRFLCNELSNLTT